MFMTALPRFYLTEMVLLWNGYAYAEQRKAFSRFSRAYFTILISYSAMVPKNGILECTACVLGNQITLWAQHSVTYKRL